MGTCLVKTKDVAMNKLSCESESESQVAINASRLAIAG
uniref:Uncharacterized protein n=1 Tax=Burkholderia sp. (strain CCGE1003) TaxID=640512 RepID=E1TBP9_BURSG